jgi:hypothetical protein
VSVKNTSETKEVRYLYSTAAATNPAMSRQRLTLQSLVVACLGASLVSFFVGKLVRQVATLSGSELSMDTPKPADAETVTQKDHFVWAFSSEQDSARCPAAAESEKGDGILDDDDDDDDDDDEDHDGSDNNAEDEDESEEIRYHLTMSLRNISRDLIESEQALFNLMQTIKDEFDLELVANGCQVLPHGATIRCLGMLDGGLISLYAWPEQSAVIFDLFAQDKEIGIGDMNLLSRIFQQKHQEEELKNIFPWADFHFGTEGNWAIRRRGDRDDTTDYDVYMEFPGDLKKAVRKIDLSRLVITGFTNHSDYNITLESYCNHVHA